MKDKIIAFVRTRTLKIFIVHNVPPNCIQKKEYRNISKQLEMFTCCFMWKGYKKEKGLLDGKKGMCLYSLLAKQEITSLNKRKRERKLVEN